MMIDIVPVGGAQNKLYGQKWPIFNQSGQWLVGYLRGKMPGMLDPSKYRPLYFKQWPYETKNGHFQPESVIS